MVVVLAKRGVQVPNFFHQMFSHSVEQFAAHGVGYRFLHPNGAHHHFLLGAIFLIRPASCLL